jgi:hypothetical protein
MLECIWTFQQISGDRMMSEEKKEVQELSLLEQFKNQHAQFIIQRDMAQNNLHQLIGALYACDLMIKRLEEEEKKSHENSGDVQESIPSE